MISTKDSSLRIIDLSIALTLWSLLVLHYGFCFGSGDQVELLPYTKFLANPLLYPNDFFLHSLHATVPNERTVFAHLLIPFLNHLQVTLFLLHFCTTVGLLLGLKKLATQFMSHTAAWTALFISFLLLNDKALGNVDLYTNAIQASDVACAVMVWALLALLDRHYWRSIMLMIIASFLHSLEAMDFMILWSMLFFLQTFLYKRVPLKQFFLVYLAYICTAGVYILLILKGKTMVQSVVPDKDIFNIMFVFRHPHHFLFSTFPMFNKLFFVLTTFAGLLFFYLKRSMLFYFMLFGFAGILVYIIATDCFHFIPVANFQFYRITPWMKVFGIIALTATVFSFLLVRFSVPNAFVYIVCTIAIVVSWTLINLDKSPFHTVYQIGNKALHQPEIDIALKAKKHTKEDALFVVPFASSEFKFWSERSTFIEFKAITKNKLFIGEWYRRIQLVYGVDTTDPHIGFEKHWPADENFGNRANSDFVTKWKQEGVTHIIIDEQLNNPLLAAVDSNSRYFIYKINLWR